MKMVQFGRDNESTLGHAEFEIPGGDGQGDVGNVETSVNLWKGRDPAYPVQHIITLILSSMLPGT